jgi:DNA transformation protein
MARRSEFCDHLVDLLAPLGDVRVRAMFGGYGVYLGQLMFGLVADDTLYLKVDNGNRTRFEAAGLPPFTSTGKHGQPIIMSYQQAPPESLEDAAVLCEWAREALEAARRAHQMQRTKTSDARSG